MQYTFQHAIYLHILALHERPIKVQACQDCPYPFMAGEQFLTISSPSCTFHTAIHYRACGQGGANAIRAGI